MIKKTPDEEEKEKKQAFYEATSEFLISDVQHIIWECFLARCACGKCGGISTYKEEVITTPRGTILKRHFESLKRLEEAKASAEFEHNRRAFANASGTNSFHAAMRANSDAFLKKLEKAKTSAAFRDDSRAFANASGTNSFHAAMRANV